ncbi:MAG: 3-oxoadipate enol-lactonase [Usitatibacter sp.]
MTSATINGITVNYELIGPSDAPVVALCHSLGTSLRLWDRQVAPLAERFRVLRYDLRGHGASGVTCGDYSVEQLARDHLALLDSLEIDRAYVCGVSLGGLIAQWLGAHAPDRVGRIVLANTAARLGVPQQWNERIALVREQGIAAIADGAIGRWFTSELTDREPDLAASFRRTLTGTSVEGYTGSCAAIRDADLRASAASIAVPALVVAGAADVVTTPDDGAWLAAHIPQASLVTLPAAHLSNVEASEQFNAAAIEFLSGGMA